MIKLFRDYYDRRGYKYKVLSYDDGRYACQSYRNGQAAYFTSDELFSSPPAKPAKVKFTDLTKKKVEAPVITNAVVEPAYEEPACEEPVYSESKNEVSSKEDNTEETAENDFYADFC